MNENESQEITEDNDNFTGENDRRKNVRRIRLDRRELIRFEIGKEDRRSATEQRSVVGNGKWQGIGI